MCLAVKNQEKIATNLWADSDDEDADSGAEDAKNEDDSNDSQQNFTILAVEPEIIADDQMLLLFKDILDQEGFSIFQERDVVLTLDDIKFLTSGIKTNEDQMDMLVTKLLEMQVKIYMLRTDEGVKVSIFEAALLFKLQHFYSVQELFHLPQKSNC